MFGRSGGWKGPQDRIGAFPDHEAGRLPGDKAREINVLPAGQKTPARLLAFRRGVRRNEEELHGNLASLSAASCSSSVSRSGRHGALFEELRVVSSNSWRIVWRTAGRVFGSRQTERAPVTAAARAAPDRDVRRACLCDQPLNRRRSSSRNVKRDGKEKSAPLAVWTTLRPSFSATLTAKSAIESPGPSGLQLQNVERLAAARGAGVGWRVVAVIHVGERPVVQATRPARSSLSTPAWSSVKSGLTTIA